MDDKSFIMSHQENSITEFSAKKISELWKITEKLVKKNYPELTRKEQDEMITNLIIRRIVVNKKKDEKHFTSDPSFKKIGKWITEEMHEQRKRKPSLALGKRVDRVEDEVFRKIESYRKTQSLEKFMNNTSPLKVPENREISIKQKKKARSSNLDSFFNK